MFRPQGTVNQDVVEEDDDKLAQIRDQMALLKSENDHDEF